MIKKVSEIIVGKRKRAINPDKVKKLAESIKLLGLIHPIMIDSQNKLIAGAHRLEAVKSLGWEEVEVTIKLGDSDTPYNHLIEIDENIMRHLSPLDEAQMLVERRVWYEKLHPEIKRGGDHKSEEFKIKSPESDPLISTFIEDTIKQTGFSKSKIKEEIKLANELTDEAKALIKGTRIENVKTYLMEIAKLESFEQSEAVKLLIANPGWSLSKIIKKVRANQYGFELNKAECIVLRESTLNEWNHGLPIEKQKGIAIGILKGKYPPFDVSSLFGVCDEQDDMVFMIKNDSMKEEKDEGGRMTDEEEEELNTETLSHGEREKDEEEEETEGRKSTKKIVPIVVMPNGSKKQLTHLSDEKFRSGLVFSWIANESGIMLDDGVQLIIVRSGHTVYVNKTEA